VRSRLARKPQSASRTRRSETRRLTKRADAEKRWQQILEVSTKLFQEKGFIGTSMQDVSDAVGLLKGSLYYYIQTKEDLLFEILKGLHIDGEEIIAAVEFGTSDPLKQLRIYLKKAAIFASNNAERLAIFHRDFDKIPEEKRSEIIMEREMYTRTVLKLIEEAKARGLTPPALDVGVAARLISAAISSTHAWLRPHGRLSLDVAAEEISRILVEGLVRRDGRTQRPKGR
jgi:AcrR family transcriptional regulator